MQMKVKKNATFLLSLLSAIILLGGLWFNWPLNFSVDAVDHFDDWSQGIMISDLMYQDNYGGSLFIQIITPPMLNQLGYSDTIGVLENAFVEGRSFPQEDFAQYISNICIHGHFYRLLNAILPISNKALITLLKFICCVWTAGMLGVILYWIGLNTSAILPLIISVIAAVACPIFTMYGTNLYWCAGNLFLPMAIMTCLVRSRKFCCDTSKQICKKLALTAFVTCLVKQLFYFEFVTSVMIAMTVPLVYWLIAERKKLIDWVRCFGATIAGAVASFVTTFAIKLLLLIIQFGWQDAIAFTYQNLEERILGTTDTTDASLLESANASYTLVLKWMMNKPCISIGSIRITMLQIIGACMVCIVGYLLLSLLCRRYLEKGFMIDNSWLALASATVISVFAPLSWFVLAKPHTFVHEVHCGFVWFCPFVFMAFALIGDTLKQAASLIVTRIRK